MWGNKLYVQLGLVVVLTVSLHLRSWSHEIFEVEFNEPVDRSVTAADIYALADHFLPSLSEPGEPALPCKLAVLPGKLDQSGALTLTVLAADTLELTQALMPRQRDLITSDTASAPPPIGIEPEIYGQDVWYPRNPLSRWDGGQIDHQGVSTLVWCPFQYNPVRNQLIVIRRAAITQLPDANATPSFDPPDTVPGLDSPDDLLLGRLRAKELSGPSLSPGIEGQPMWTWPADPPLGVEYVVITGNEFVDVLKPLVEWKARRGIRAGLATVETIVAQYPGEDQAAAVREYLKAAYAAGLEWVLLAGDETVVPMRLAYAGYSDNPTDPYDFQICDMYFAELDGDWDADGDGIYGEYFGDHAELTTELFVGRLPFSDANEAKTIVDKIIAYERGPEDAAYLARALEVSADQMRDWSGGTGQQKVVADAMPASWTVDQNTMLEEPSGDNLTPTAPDGPTLPSLLSSGYGWVNYFVHGRADGMVVRASGYSDWPKSYVWTFGTSGDGHGHLNEMTPSPYPGIHLSIGCDHGGFDMDTPPFAPGIGESVAERLLFTPEGGAVAFVGQSRWGWVSSSYRMLEEFYKQVGDESTPNHIGVYQVLARAILPQYRDLNFGNNLYGDPEMPVWKDIPRSWSVSAPTTYESGGAPWVINVNDASGPVANAMVTVALGDSVWEVGATGADGRVASYLDLPVASEVLLTVSKAGYRVYTDTVPHTIATGITDDDNGESNTPNVFANSPNPFNPSTMVRFSLAQPGSVSLTIYDILGRTVRRLIDADYETGTFDVPFDGRDDRGQVLASGIYLARLSGSGMARTLKMVLLR